MGVVVVLVVLLLLLGIYTIFVEFLLKVVIICFMADDTKEQLPMPPPRQKKPGIPVAAYRAHWEERKNKR